MMLRNAWKWSLNAKNSNQKVVGGWLKLPFEFYIWPITILWAIWVCFIDLSETTFISCYFSLTNKFSDSWNLSWVIHHMMVTLTLVKVLGNRFFFFFLFGDYQEIHLQPVACCKEICLGKCAAFQDTFEKGQQSSLFTIFIAFFQVA